MTDAVSRWSAINTAIDAADEWDGGSNPERSKMIHDALMGLPSADVRTQMSSADLISRKAAIDAVGKYLKKDGDVITIADVVDAAVAIGMLPSAEPERKKPDHGYMWICPECGLEVHSDFRRCVRCGWDRPNKGEPA